ncbi:conserved hypothetical protein, partial [Streptomyces sp. SPB78]|uniref:right-handed parallel beta-helix repeat-containing protein n=1 Tax=Streptomyces sp. (strain SPB78) TaxID=591157 RepID=UPI0001B56977
LDLAKGSAYFGGFGPYDDTPCTDILIEGCSVGPSGTSGTTSWPRAVGSHSASPGKPHTDVRVRDLRAEGCAQFVVGAYTWQDSLISGIQARNCGAGVRVRTIDSSTASHRTPAGGSSPTITGSQPLTNIVVEDVTMTGGGGYDAAVRIEGEDTGYVGGVIVSNIVTRNIAAQAVRLVDVEDYLVADVAAVQCGATAVSTLGTRRGRIRGAHINGVTTGAGITVDSRSTPAATATDVTVEGCSVTGVQANGIHIFSGADVTVSDCDLYALTGYGVQVSTNTDRLTIRNVRTRGTSSTGVNITSTVTNAVLYGVTGSTADASVSTTNPYAWQTITLSGTWAHTGSPLDPLPMARWTPDGSLELSGVVKGTAVAAGASSPLGTLPATLLPATWVRGLGATSAGAPGPFTVAVSPSTGAMTLYNSGSTAGTVSHWYQLDGIRGRAR